MKIMFVSDIHGSLKYTKRMLEIFELEQADLLVILGDYLYHGPRNSLPSEYNTQAVATLLNQYKDKIIGIRGNCESEVDEMLLDFPLVSSSYLLLDGKKVFLTHGHIYNEDNMAKLSPGDILIRGHFHVPVYRMVDQILVLSPGSVSIPKQWSTHSYMIYTQQAFHIKDFEQNDISELVKSKTSSPQY
jgi:uncharacterized protein